MTKKRILYHIIAFDNSDGNFTGNPGSIACNLPRNTAINMLRTYRSLPITAQKYRYIIKRQS